MNYKLKDQALGAIIISQVLALPISLFSTAMEYFHISLSRSQHTLS